MLGLLIGLAIRHARVGGSVPPPAAPAAPALLAEDAGHLLTETGSLLLLE